MKITVLLLALTKWSTKQLTVQRDAPASDPQAGDMLLEPEDIPRLEGQMQDVQVDYGMFFQVVKERVEAPGRDGSSIPFPTRPSTAASGDRCKTNSMPLLPSYVKGSVPRMMPSALLPTLCASSMTYKNVFVSFTNGNGDACREMTILAVPSTTSPFSKMRLVYITSPYSGGAQSSQIRILNEALTLRSRRFVLCV